MAENKLDGCSPHPNVEQITRILVDRFRRPKLGNKRNPFNELLYIILSSKTPPSRYQEVYSALRSIYSRADDLADARPGDVAKLISRGGLQNRKGLAITSIARRLQREFGRVTLAPLARMSDEEAEGFLASLPEVSKKTARCVLLYSLDRRVFPVDSHCFRISQRLTWAHQDGCLTDDRADELQNRVPADLRRDLHIGMVILGRHYCLPKKLRCKSCPLLDLCPTGITLGHDSTYSTFAERG